MLEESYTRAYNSLILTQQLSELEEISEYCKLAKKAKQAKRPNYLHSISSGCSLDPVGLVNGFERFDNDERTDDGSPVGGRAGGMEVNTNQWTHNNRQVNYAESACAKFYCNPRLSDTSKLDADDEEGEDKCGLAKEAAEYKSLLIDKWKKRIRGIPRSGKAAIPYFLKILNLRRMIGEAREDIDTFKDFATLCRHNGNWELSRRSLMFIIGSNMVDNASPSLATSILSPDMPQYSPNKAATVSFLTKAGGIGKAEATESPFCPNKGTGPSQCRGGIFGNFTDVDTVVKDCRIELEKLRLQWNLGDQVEATSKLSEVVTELGIYAQTSGRGSAALERVYVQCLLKYADWKLRLIGPGVVVPPDTRTEVLKLYAEATAIAPTKYQAWHQWGMSNYNALTDLSTGRDINLELILWLQCHMQSCVITLTSYVCFFPFTGKGIRNHHFVMGLKNTATDPVDNVNEYVLNAMKGFAHAMSLGVSRYIGSVMQDMLSLLQIWFKYSESPGVGPMLQEYLGDIPLDCWLGVLPQLIARIHHEGDIGRTLLHDLLSRLGTLHAQALMFPLSVALQSPREDRQNAAQLLLMNLRQHSAPLIDQSVLVSQELIRIAILWDEEWFSTLEDASRLYFTDGNVQKMLDLLLPLHEKLSDGPRTSNEQAFMQSYGNELKEAHQCLIDYVSLMDNSATGIPTSGARPAQKTGGQSRSSEEALLVRAWDLYIPIFKRITPTLKQIVSHNMSVVSPQLVDAHDLDLAIPGTYTLTGEAVRIKGFSKQFSVILSKQRPRKIRLFGLDGLEYVFLLKGHEDLRQDERAMQLFGLVNALLEHDHRTVDHDLSIQRYAVVPLSPNAGLVGWVPQCDTLHDLIRTYRQSKNIMLDVEQMLMQQLCPFNMFGQLAPLQKLEVFEHALKNTSGQDLHKILWYHSPSSESWIIRRDTYTKSLAVMSVVGYVLGLGDRHPSNLMLQRNTCKILHIDFGDCFEVAMHRDKFPEKIPFRLTRMLVTAMEVGRQRMFTLCFVC